MYTAGNVADNEYVVCLYVRLSIEDADVFGSTYKTESGSITTQRALLHDYIKNHKEFEGCKNIEKCDDGFSGTHFDNRPQFTEMMELAKKGKINCIIVKDFSRFGRDYVELGNYLEQLFPFLGVRFISVNDNYDSAKLADGTTGGLDVAFKNLIYDYYSREMSRKQRIVWQRMAEQGQYNSTCALYGYQKSKEDKHKLVIEPEEAAVVREIFNMKIAGIGTTLIAKTLNDREIPSPTELYRSRGNTRRWRNKGNKCYWTACKVEDIIKDEKYTGTMVQLKTKMDSVGGKQVNRPKEEWVRVENTHEPIVTYPQYIRAVSSLKQQKATERKNLKNIYYCGCCGRALFNAHYGTVFCQQRLFKTDSDCRDIKIYKYDADMAVLASIKKETKIFLDHSKLSRQGVKRTSPLSVADKVNAIMRSMEVAQKSWIALYDKYADGKLEREFFLNEKKRYDADMKKMEEELAALRQAQEEEVKCYTKVVTGVANEI
ncbi:MAG: recombinase family protein [Lachnospiraceae bacterium]|jgi:site-specific DNA recombinase|nr:recombinase family protein [Lachnospiraceae bacterium]